jgi:hypothetical protein
MGRRTRQATRQGDPARTRKAGRRSPATTARPTASSTASRTTAPPTASDPQSTEVISHIEALKTVGRFDAAMMLHEDFEGIGAYLYELNDALPPALGGAIIAAMGRHVPVDLRPVIEDVPAHGGVLSRKDLVAKARRHRGPPRLARSDLPQRPSHAGQLHHRNSGALSARAACAGADRRGADPARRPLVVNLVSPVKNLPPHVLHVPPV